MRKTSTVPRALWDCSGRPSVLPGLASRFHGHRVQLPLQEPLCIGTCYRKRNALRGDSKLMPEAGGRRMCSVSESARLKVGFNWLISLMRTQKLSGARCVVMCSGVVSCYIIGYGACLSVLPCAYKELAASRGRFFKSVCGDV